MILVPGMLAKSKAGRDKNCIYVIISVNDEYVYLADGEKFPVCQTKKKNRKHVQPIKKVQCGSLTDDEEIKQEIKRYCERPGRAHERSTGNPAERILIKNEKKAPVNTAGVTGKQKVQKARED